jgi:hypothetical protein
MHIGAVSDAQQSELAGVGNVPQGVGGYPADEGARPEIRVGTG